MVNNKEYSKYKSIGEVARILNLFNKKKGSLSTHTIRFWEKEFKQVKPKVFNGNRRYYDENTINILKRIKYLLKEKGMTLNGAKKLLNSELSDIDELYNTTINQKNNIKSRINKIKNIITNIKTTNGKKNTR
ncbi:MerR family transcriptional regulator [Candidatus Pelagibacter sp.]|nr:MerR family transcriptional regulator [Candidatus Pelagibacter sp.]|tara:strand:+ start:265 stop:660 length:396 start_codon:yes stop_codon:yes gene_type:complete